MIDEGYIKYQCYWTSQDSVTEEEIIVLNQWRNRLYQLGLIGEYDNGIGFGNVSCRLNPENHFMISGTQTGAGPSGGLRVAGLPRRSRPTRVASRSG